MKRNESAWIGLLLLLFSGCVPQKAPPKIATPDFTFNPPGASASRVDMTIALIKPTTPASMFRENAMTDPDHLARVRRYVVDMLDQAKKDLEKILVAKGFNTLGPYESIDEMTYSEKERASLIFAPNFEVNIDFVGGAVAQGGLGTVSQQGTVAMTGRVVLNFLEPMTKEKVSMKNFSVDPFSAPYTVSARTRDPKSGDILTAILLGGSRQPENTMVDASVLALNNFYQTSMTKISNLLDTREILQLRGETQKLKKLKRY